MTGFLHALRSWSLAAALLLCATPAFAGFIETFDDGTADGWTLDGLWHVTGNSPNGTNALGYVKDETPGTALNGNFDTGTTNAGTALSPSLICGSVCDLAFDWLDDSEGGTTFDRFEVAVTTATGGPFIVFEPTARTTTYSSFTADLTPFVTSGTEFQVAFQFDTIDPVANFYSGVRVDNVSVTTIDTAPSPVPVPATLLLMGLGLAAMVGRLRR